MPTQTGSVKQWVLESLAIPVTVLVEDEDLAWSGVTEDQVGIEHVNLPHERHIDLAWLNFLQIANIDVVALNLTK